MPYNGSGAFSPPSSSFPAVDGTLIDPVKYNTVINDIATGLTTALTKDGQTSATNNIAFGGFKATGLGLATARTDGASLASIQDGTGVYVATVAGTVDAILLSPAPSILSYVAGQTFRFIPIGTNTGPVTVAVSGLPVRNVTKNGTLPIVAGDLPAGGIANLTYNGTNFILMTSGRDFATLTGTEILSNKTLMSPVINTGTVGAPPTVALGVANKGYVDSLWTTGDVKLTLKIIADTGWVFMNDGNIGNAASAATTRAHADTEALFILLWTNTVQADCVVSSGRGASAAADFAANKTINLPKALGRALACYGAGSGLTARTLAKIVGEETHTPTIAEMAAHLHPGSVTGGVGAVGDDGVSLAAGGNSSTNARALSIASQGSGTPFNVMQPTTFLNVMIKL